MSAGANTCLIVDDDSDFVAALSAALARRGYRVVSAGDAVTAQAIAVREQPGDIVLDLRLGEDSGLELVEPLLAASPHARLVVLTGYASIATAVQAIKLGAVEYLTKPADAGEIVAAFSKHRGDATVDVSERPTPLMHLEWEHIQKTLVACAGNISAAAKRLGMHRRTLQRKLQKRPAGL